MFLIIHASSMKQCYLKHRHCWIKCLVNGLLLEKTEKKRGRDTQDPTAIFTFNSFGDD